ncbi:MAG TPA: hypothetical protein VGQ00_02630 [Candidatus Norongarragalinales archaeon]|jgi:hypothetical protein|nr:hypothetical protein [Candidatus Norongarragalinales archaeon]
MKKALLLLAIVIFASFAIAQTESRLPPAPELTKETFDVTTEAQLVQLYCHTSKWRTLMYLDAIDIASVEFDKAKTFCGIDFQPPQVTALKTQARTRLQEVCSAKTIAEAHRAAEELVRIGSELEAAYHNMGEDISDKLNEKIRPSREASDAKVRACAEEKGAALKARLEAKYSNMPYDEHTDYAAIQAQIVADIKTGADEIQRECRQIAASEEERIKTELKPCTDALQAAGEKAQHALDNPSGEVIDEKNKAIELRKALIDKLVDQKIEDVLQEVQKINNTIIANPSGGGRITLPSPEEVKLKLNEEREKLKQECDGNKAGAVNSAVSQANAKMGEFQSRLQAAQAQASQSQQG